MSLLCPQTFSSLNASQKVFSRVSSLRVEYKLAVNILCFPRSCSASGNELLMSFPMIMYD